eukprot:7765108-Pyramimonas_sp.AAC.1
MERMMALQQLATPSESAAVTPQRNRTSTPVVTPSPVSLAGPGADGTGAPQRSALMAPQMAVTDHDHAIDILGVGPQRQNMIQLSQEISSSTCATMPYSAWWAQIPRCKGLAQWQTKLQTLGVPPAEAQAASSFSK